MADRVTVGRLLRRIRSMRTRLVLAGLATLIGTGSTLVLPWIVKHFVDVMLSQSGGVSRALALALLLLFVVSGVFSAAQIYLLASVGQRFVNNLMVEVYSRVQHLSLSFFDKQRVGELISRIMNDTTLLREAVSGVLIGLITEVITAIGALVLMFALDWRLSFVVLTVVPLVVLLGNISGEWMRWATDELQKKMADITSLAEQNLGGIRVVKSFAREDHESRRFADQADGVYVASMRQAKIVAVLQPLISSITMIAILGVLYYGAHRVASGALSPGDLIAFLLYIVVLTGPATGLVGMYMGLQEALAAADRVFSLLDTKPEIVDSPGAVELERVAGHVEFKDVGFSYDGGEAVLEGLRLSVRPGQVVALIGASGVGKTTMVSLLPRFYEVDTGSVLLDGMDIRKIKLSSLRSHIGFVAQDVLLFSGTIRENIRYGRLSATDVEVEAAARAANAHDFVSSFRDGYDALVGERGMKLSGGQRQRISIARALLSDPDVLVLDEATSSLDAESESLVRQAVGRLMSGRTTFIIAHRLSTVVNADRIALLDAGKIAAQGTHEELMRASEQYRRLYARQFQQPASSRT